MTKPDLSPTAHLQLDHPYEQQAARHLLARALRTMISGNRLSLDYAAVAFLLERLPLIDPQGACVALAAELEHGHHEIGTVPAFSKLVFELMAASEVAILSPMQERLGRICTLLELDPVDEIILGVALRCSGLGFLGGIGSILKSPRTDFPLGARDYLPLMTGMPQEKLEGRLAKDAPLFVHGLLSDGSDCEPGSILMDAMLATEFDEGALLERFVTHPKTDLSWDDFSHMHEALSDLERILNSRLAGGQNTNILFYGVPGTGKTELAHLIAARLDMPIVAFDQGEMRGRRFFGEDLANALRARKQIASLIPRSLVLIDEADDLLSGLDDPNLAQRSAPKLHVNQSVELASRPTIWITNHPERLGASVLRRMTYALSFQVPGRAHRAAMLRRIFARHGLRLSGRESEQLAGRFEAPAAVFANAARATSEAKGNLELFSATTQSILSLLGRDSPMRRDATPFSVEFINASENPAGFVASLVQQKERDVSILLHGPSGTGKTAFANFLAEELGLDLLEVRASDLLSKWHGETERNIANAFREAEQKQAVLFFDEVDSLLSSRSKATYSWEISQKNEMLTWLEAAKVPVLAATNRLPDIDEAAMRRFMFKMEFLPLKREQARQAFTRFFGFALSPRLALPQSVCIGDLAVVKRRLAFRPAQNASEIIDLLKQETFYQRRKTYMPGNSPELSRHGPMTQGDR